MLQPVIERKVPVRRIPSEQIEEESEEDLDSMFLDESLDSTEDKDQEWHAGYTPGYGNVK